MIEPKIKRVHFRLDKKLVDKFAKICAKQNFSMNLVIEKYLQKVAHEGRIATEEWS